MRYLPILVLLLASPPAFAAGEPIIDMHFHAWPRGADGPPDDPGNLEVMEAALAQLREYNVVLAATSGPTAFIDRWAQEEPDRLMLGPIFPCINGLNPNWHQYRCFDSGEDFPDLAWLEEKYASGAYELMGELTNQYAGVAFDDPRMDPYYALAERLAIPVAFHTHAGPPLTASRCCPDFRISLGDPMSIEKILVKFPKLRVYIMHANPLVYPAVLDLLVQYPKVYVDVSQFQRILIREKFHRLLKEFKDAGLLGRVMLGVDGDDYGSALEAYSSAPFLNERELRGIFCENAARFLRRPELCALASDAN